MPRLIAQRRLRSPRRYEQRDRCTEFATGPERADHAETRERFGQLRDGLGAPPALGSDERAHRDHAHLLGAQRVEGRGALEVRATNAQRAQGANALCARCA